MPVTSENSAKRRKIQPSIGQPLTKLQSLELTFNEHIDLKEDDMVAVPRNGDRFDFGSVTAVNENTVTCLLGRDPLLKKELPYILCGRLRNSAPGLEEGTSDSEARRIDELEKSSRDLHAYVQRADVNLLTVPVRTMISFVQSHIAFALATLARRKCTDLGGTARQSISLGQDDLLREIITAERKSSALHNEALIKINQAYEQKWSMLYDLIEKKTSGADIRRSSLDE